MHLNFPAGMTAVCFWLIWQIEPIVFVVFFHTPPCEAVKKGVALEIVQTFSN